MARRIRALDENLVQKIAAGEIVVSPANALKELIENSLDAGASNIDVIVKEGGYKLMQITDNGHGIEEEDLPILAQRFTTSKITSFEDLETVSTLGFRGEALASISHIAHLSVKTKVNDAKLATQALYQDGKLLQQKHMAGNTGTQISVEDLFFNLPQRAKALRASSDSAEYKKILDVVSRYAIQYPCTFSCKKWQDSQPIVIPGTDQKEKIRKVFGSSVSQELQQLHIPANEDIGLAGANGWVTGLNFSKRGMPLIFFINNRLVTCEPLARGIRKVYASHMPRGDSYPFVFLSLQIESANVDVNIHPTKREVQFLHDQEIVESICTGIENLLTLSDHSREFRIQSYITATTLPSVRPPSSASGDHNEALSNTVPASQGGTRYEYKLVRTDPKQLTLSSYSHRMAQVQEPTPPRSAADETQESVTGSSDMLNRDESDDSYLINQPETADTEYRELRLASVQALVQQTKDRASSRLLQLFNEHTFVGIIDKIHACAAIQQDVRLYLVKYNDVISELIYQIGLQDFGNFGTIHLGDGLPLEALLELAGTDATGLDQVVAMASMLEDYFRIRVSEKAGQWRLEQLPLLVPGYAPPISRYPQLIADLTNAVDWGDEQECLRSVLRALATAHLPTTETANEQIQLLFDTAKTALVPTQELLPNVIEIANLPRLYRVFERC